MLRLMRWVLLLVFLGLGLIFLLPFLLPASAFKTQIENAALRATGRTLSIAGDLKLTLWPRIGIEARDVTFSNAPWAKTPLMARMDALNVAAELMPLLSGELRITELTLIKPVIRLETGSQGQVNWDFSDKSSRPNASDSGPGAGFNEIALPLLSIRQGHITVSDARRPGEQTIEAIDGQLIMPGLDRAARFDGSLRYRGEALKFNASIERPRALIDGSSTSFLVASASQLIDGRFRGRLNLSTQSAEGEIEMKTSSIARLSRWVGAGLPNNTALGAAALSGQLRIGGNEVALSSLRLSLHGMNARGALTFATTQKTPKLTGVLNIDRLDLTPFVGSSRALDGATEGLGWSSHAFDLAPLNAIQADLELTADALKAADIEAQANRIKLTIAQGLLNAQIRSVSLYGGHGAGWVRLDARGQIAANLQFAGVAVEPLLKGLVDYDRLSGQGELVFALTARGANQKALMESLNGTIRFAVRDGAIRGVDLAAAARSVQKALTAQATSAAAKTDFASLSASFAVREGVAANKDLVLLNPFVRMTGKGLIDIGRRTIDYRIEPKAVTTIEGQGGTANLAGVMVPFRIKGPWASPSYSPDIQGLMESELEQILKGGGNSEGGLFPGLLPQDQPGGPKDKKDQGPDQSAPKKPKPEDFLKGLIPGH